MKIFSKSQIKIIENNASSQGVPFMRMMENAGAACAKVIRENYPQSVNNFVTVLCGRGKNGGDGFVIARKLHENGYKVAVVLTNGMPNNEESAEMLVRVKALPINILRLESDPEKCATLITKSDLLVDAIFGIGFSGIAERDTSLLFKLINSSTAKKISIDIPSGIECDKKEVIGECVKADMTITVIALKKALVSFPAADYAGEVKLVNIGIPESCLEGLTEDMYSLSEDEIKEFFNKREPNSHKGNYGRVLMAVGSYEMSGAAVLAANAAINSGVGLVKLAFPDKAYMAIAPQVTEPVLLPLHSNSSGRFCSASFNEIEEDLEKANAVLIGCGMGLDFDTIQFTYKLIKNAKCPIIIDADGLNAISENIDILKLAKAPIILTPHSGEMARLLGISIEDVEKSRVAAVKRLQGITGATVVLKGAGTLVLGLNEMAPYINQTGNAGMATGGSGDVLAGIITSFVGQKMDILSAVIAAVFIHGASGDEVSKKYSQMGNTPTKIIKELPRTLSKFE